MAKLDMEISIKDTEVFKELLEFTNRIIDDLEEEGCFSLKVSNYGRELSQIIEKKGE